MRHFFFFAFFLYYSATAQVETSGGQACRAGKIQYAERVANNPKARLAYPGDPSIDVTYYGLDLHLSTTPNNLRAAATITLKSTTASLNSFFLDLNSTTVTSGIGLRVDSVKADSQKLTFQHEQNKLTIMPSKPLANGQAMTLTVFYQGVPANQGSFKFDRHETTTDPVIWNLSEPYGASDWFPCRDTPADKADSSSVRIAAPTAFVSASNGTLISKTDNPDGTRTYFWKNSYPIAQYLISIAVSNYAQYDTPYVYGNQSMPVTHYVYPENLAQVQASLDLTPKMIALFTNRFGPYPFLREKYGHAQFARNNGGMEHQTITSMGISSLTPNVIAHELTHQWFGDKITCRDWENIWLNEGFASYGEAVYAEFVGGQAGYQTYINGFMTQARNARGSIYVQDISSINSIFSYGRSYAKGATVLHMLRGVVGDSTFYRTLRTYVATPALAYNTAVTEDFQAVAQQVSGKDLGYFFKQWIYGEGYPTYRATVLAGSSATTVSVRLEQRNTIATNPSSFTMPVQLRVQSAAGDTLVTVLNNQPDQTFMLPTKGLVTGVVIDPNNWILKAVDAPAVITALQEPVMGALHIYPNPTAEMLTVDFSLSVAGPVTLSLTNQLGQRVRSGKDVMLPAGKNSQTLPLLGLSAGRYIITVETSGSQQSQAVLVR